MIVKAYLYSGRPDPAWPLDEAQRGELARRLAFLPAAAALAAPPPGLGYRGLYVAPIADVLNGATSVHVAHGHVHVARADGSLELLDEGRALERWLVGLARTQLPAHVVDTIARAAGL